MLSRVWTNILKSYIQKLVSKFIDGQNEIIWNQLLKVRAIYATE